MVAFQTGVSLVGHYMQVERERERGCGKELGEGYEPFRYHFFLMIFIFILYTL